MTAATAISCPSNLLAQTPMASSHTNDQQDDGDDEVAAEYEHRQPGRRGPDPGLSRATGGIRQLCAFGPGRAGTGAVGAAAARRRPLEPASRSAPPPRQRQRPRPARVATCAEFTLGEQGPAISSVPDSRSSTLMMMPASDVQPARVDPRAKDLAVVAQQQQEHGRPATAPRPGSGRLVGDQPERGCPGSARCPAASASSAEKVHQIKRLGVVGAAVQRVPHPQHVTERIAVARVTAAAPMMLASSKTMANSAPNM